MKEPTAPTGELKGADANENHYQSAPRFLGMTAEQALQTLQDDLKNYDDNAVGAVEEGVDGLFRIIIKAIPAFEKLGAKILVEGYANQGGKPAVSLCFEDETVALLNLDLVSYSREGSTVQGVAELRGYYFGLARGLSEKLSLAKQLLEIYSKREKEN